MSDYNLAIGSSQLLLALKERYTELNDLEIERLASALIGRVGEYLGAGEDLAFLRQTSDGKAELTILRLDVIEKSKQ